MGNFGGGNFRGAVLAVLELLIFWEFYPSPFPSIICIDKYSDLFQKSEG